MCLSKICLDKRHQSNNDKNYVWCIIIYTGLVTLYYIVYWYKNKYLIVFFNPLFLNQKSSWQFWLQVDNKMDGTKWIITSLSQVPVTLPMCFAHWGLVRDAQRLWIPNSRNALDLVYIAEVSKFFWSNLKLNKNTLSKSIIWYKKNW